MNTTHTEENKKYTELGGLFFNPETNTEVMRRIFTAYNTKERIRIFYGDIKTGRDWLEENDNIGKISRSMGTYKIPLLIKSRRSIGGGGILTHCIVKITDENKKIIYQHPKYFLPLIEVRETSVYVEGKIQALFRTVKQANNYKAFLQGDRNSK